MKLKRTPQFLEDYNHKLNDRERAAWDKAFSNIVKALHGDSELHLYFRMKKMEGWPGMEGIWEGHVKYDLCFTYHFETSEDGEKDCLFRRIGTHKIYSKP